MLVLEPYSVERTEVRSRPSPNPPLAATTTLYHKSSTNDFVSETIISIQHKQPSVGALTDQICQHLNSSKENKTFFYLFKFLKSFFFYSKKNIPNILY